MVLNGLAGVNFTGKVTFQPWLEGGKERTSESASSCFTSPTLAAELEAEATSKLLEGLRSPRGPPSPPSVTFSWEKALEDSVENADMDRSQAGHDPAGIRDYSNVSTWPFKGWLLISSRRLSLYGNVSSVSPELIPQDNSEMLSLISSLPAFICSLVIQLVFLNTMHNKT